MADLLSPIRRRLKIHGCTLVRHHEYDAAAQMLLVELKGRFALAIERQIWIQLHGAPLSGISGLFG
jgi:hypothetical protein